MKHRNGNHPKAVENYTAPFLVTAALLIFMLLWTLAALGGFILAGAFAVTFNTVIAILRRRRI
jgi:hypothetical protein